MSKIISRLIIQVQNSNAINLTLFPNVVVPLIFISLILSWAKADSAEVSNSSELPMISLELITESKYKIRFTKLILISKHGKLIKNGKTIISENYKQVLTSFEN